MSSLFRLLAGLAASACLLATAQSLPLSPRVSPDDVIPDIVRPVALKSTPVTPPKPDAGVLRSRAVELDLGALARSTPSTKSQARTVRVAFFDDAALLVEITAVAPTSSGGLAYTGHVPGIPHSMAVLVDNQGTVSFNVNVLSRVYTITGSPKDGFVARELTDVRRKPHSRNPPEGVSLPGDREAAPGRPLTKDTGTDIDLMVVYSPAARVNAGGTAAMNAMIDAQVALTNTIYANSGVVQRLRLVYKGEISYVETDDNTDLDRVRNTADGFMDEVPVLRDLYGADFVSLWGAYPGTCGLGFIMTTEAASFHPNAYNVVNSPSCTTGTNTTMAHELGHNMGLHHDPFQSPGTTTNVTPEAGGALVNIPYAHGYVDTTNRFITVMSYTTQCNSLGIFCNEIPRFSNTSLTFDNRPNYAPANPNAVTGDANSREQQALNDTRETTINFRQSVGSLTGPGIVVFLPNSYTVTEGGMVQVSVARHVGSTGAITVNYATADGDALAGSDFTAVSGMLSWANGDTSVKTINIATLQDAVLEGREAFTLVLSGATGGASVGSSGGSTTAATIRITDDEPDNFPPGGVVPASYTQATPSRPWDVDMTDGHLGNTSLRSAEVVSAMQNVYESSDISFTGTFVAGNIGFAYRVSSHLQNGTVSWGDFQFLVDGAVRFTSAAGEVPWTTRTEAITAGTHTITFRYRSRLGFPCANAVGGNPGCQDRAWVDSVSLPLAGNTLNILKTGTGTGVVTGTGISCGIDCSETTAPGAMITLTATPDMGSTFGGWSGGGCSGTGQCTVTVNSSIDVTATFVGPPEAFPPNCTMPAGFTVPAGSNAGWAVATDRARSGTCSLKSEDIGEAPGPGAVNATKARIETTGNYLAGNVSFYYNVSSEAGYDCLRFLVDGVQRAEMGSCNGPGGPGGFGASGNISTWTQVTVPVTAGTHTFVWSYEKDDTVTTGADAGWIDDLTLPPLAAPGALQFSAAAQAVGEAGGSVTLNVTRTGGSAGAASVAFATANGSATAGSDYTTQAGTLNWADGDTATKTIVVPILDDGTAEAGETFTVTLSNATGAVLGATTAVTVTITDDDAPPGAPTIGAATAGNGQALIAFTAPASSGSSPVTGYTVTCNPGPVTATGSASPILVSPLANGTPYTCSVTATNAVGTGPASGTVGVTPSGTPPFALFNVESRKVHGAAGSLAIPVNHTIPLAGPVSVEPRAEDSTHTIVFVFTGAVTSKGTVSISPVGSATHDNVGNEIRVNVSAVPDNNRVTISLMGVNGGTNVSASIGFLVGDVNGTRAVTAADIAAVRATQGQAANAARAARDVNTSGTVDAADTAAVKARAAKVIP